MRFLHALCHSTVYLREQLYRSNNNSFPLMLEIFASARMADTYCNSALVTTPRCKPHVDTLVKSYTPGSVLSAVILEFSLVVTYSRNFY